jgi:predicted RNA binding protein YcfA (HicA-like mRNA interferase family)
MSQRLPALRPRRVLQALQRAGFFVHHTAGSHYVLKHPEKPTFRVAVPYHNKDLKRRTLASIIEQARMTVDEFIRLL